MANHKGLRLEGLAPEVQARIRAQIEKQYPTKPRLVPHFVLRITVGATPELGIAGKVCDYPAITDRDAVIKRAIKFQKAHPQALVDILTFEKEM